MRAHGYTRSTVAIIGTALVLTSCSSSSKPDAAASTTTRAAATSSTMPRPAGPVADVAKELTGGKGVAYIAEAAAPDLKADGFTEHEYEATGTASSYNKVGALGKDGRWKFAAGSTAPFRTRVLVRAPADAKKFSGNVIVEWLNVSAGVDADPEWVMAHEEIVRAGDAWVGVSAQGIGVEGGPTVVKVTGVPGSEQQGKGLKKIDPARYGDLHHPGDAYAYDIYTQVARAVRAGGALNGLQPQRLIAAGQSQSAAAMVTYFNGVQPLTHAFDAFFVHSRFATGLPLVATGKYADIAGALQAGHPAILRTDQKVPVLDIQTETDVTSFLASYSVRQPDTAHFRLWEVAGTAHADAYQVGANEKYLDCGVPINDGPMHIVVKAAWHALDAWLTTGTPPPPAPRLAVVPNGNTAPAKRDADGIALGGIRTPPVDVPVEALSGVAGPNPSTICLLLGSAPPLPAARIAQLYPTRADYQQKFEADANATIKAGYALPEDRAALLAFAKPDRVA